MPILSTADLASTPPPPSHASLPGPHQSPGSLAGHRSWLPNLGGVVAFGSPFRGVQQILVDSRGSTLPVIFKSFFRGRTPLGPLVIRRTCCTSIWFGWDISSDCNKSCELLTVVTTWDKSCFTFPPLHSMRRPFRRFMSRCAGSFNWLRHHEWILLYRFCMHGVAQLPGMYNVHVRYQWIEPWPWAVVVSRSCFVFFLQNEFCHINLCITRHYAMHFAPVFENNLQVNITRNTGVSRWILMFFLVFWPTRYSIHPSASAERTMCPRLWNARTGRLLGGGITV